MLSVFMLNVAKEALSAQCHYAECCYAECRGALSENVASPASASSEQQI
jgi:hypothetical protein